jgi:hypothetical protein
MIAKMMKEDIPQGKTFCKKVDTDKGSKKTNGCPTVSYRNDGNKKNNVACKKVFPMIIQ